MDIKKTAQFLKRIVPKRMLGCKMQRRRQKIGFIIGFGVGLGCLVGLAIPGQEKFYVKGAMNIGHDDLSCQACHRLAQGTMRQQMQANTRFLIGLRETQVDFGYEKVTNAICLECHDRPNDRHPVFRFFEPRFGEARQKIQPQFCSSCHLEHSGKRVTLSQISYCIHCHKETKLRNDLVTVSHEELILADNWESCLGCHDFHGNHVMKTNTVVEKALSSSQIREYFDGGASPYSEKKYYKAKVEANDE